MRRLLVGAAAAAALVFAAPVASAQQGPPEEPPGQAIRQCIAAVLPDLISGELTGQEFSQIVVACVEDNRPTPS